MLSLLKGCTYQNLTVPTKTIPPSLARRYAGGTQRLQAGGVTELWRD
jgi:hypothetical protein